MYDLASGLWLSLVHIVWSCFWLIQSSFRHSLLHCVSFFFWFLQSNSMFHCYICMASPIQFPSFTVTLCDFVSSVVSYMLSYALCLFSVTDLCDMIASFCLIWCNPISRVHTAISNHFFSVRLQGGRHLKPLNPLLTNLLISVFSSCIRPHKTSSHHKSCLYKSTTRCKECLYCTTRYDRCCLWKITIMKTFAKFIYIFQNISALVYIGLICFLSCWLSSVFVSLSLQLYSTVSANKYFTFKF